MTLNKAKIVEIMRKSPTAEAFATYAACRERNIRDGVSKLPVIRTQLLKEGFHPVPQELVSMFRELERAGVGVLRGDQFQWHVSIKAIGEAAAAHKPTKIKDEHYKQYPELTKRVEKTLSICLGSGKDVTISFTTNLSKEDCAWICRELLQQCQE